MLAMLAFTMKSEGVFSLMATLQTLLVAVQQRSSVCFASAASGKMVATKATSLDHESKEWMLAHFLLGLGLATCPPLLQWARVASGLGT